MIGFVFHRLIATIPIMLVVALFVFSLINLAGGDPALVLAGDNATPEQIERVRNAFGLDRPFFVRFFVWLGAVAQGDLGISLLTQRPVAVLIGQRLEPTLSLAICTLVLSVALAVPLGMVAAWRSGTWIDGFVSSLSVLGFSVPIFVMAYIAIFVFALELRWLPVQGFTGIAQGLGPFLSHIAMPSLVLSIAYVGLIARITRACVLDVLTQDYIRTAAAKGAGPRRILALHALKNAGIPIVTVIGTGFAGLIGGVVVTETVFGISGLGRLTVEAIAQRDYPIIQGVVLLMSMVYVLVNLAVDLSYGLFDPRLRH